MKRFLPITKRRSVQKRLAAVHRDIEFSPEVVKAYEDIRKDAIPFNWMVTGYCGNEAESTASPTKLILLETGMV